MPRRSDLPLSKHVLNLYDEDWQYLVRMFGPEGHVNSGASEVIRKVIHKFCRRMQQAAADAEDEERKV